MKKIFLTTSVCLLLLLVAQGQTMHKKDAQQILEHALRYLKTSDTASFINLWLLDDSPYPFHQHPFTVEDVKNDFAHLKVFLDTALAQNYKIDHIEIEKEESKNKNERLGEYLVKAWFKYNEHYYKGFGFYVEYKNERWVVRFSPDTSSMTKD